MPVASILKSLLVIVAGAVFGAALLTCAFLTQRVGDWMSPTNAAIGGAILGGMLAGIGWWRLVGLYCPGMALGGAGIATVFRGAGDDGSLLILLVLGCIVGGAIGSAVEAICWHTVETTE